MFSILMPLVLFLVFGLAATSQVAWDRLAGTLREESRSTGGRARTLRRSALIVAEVSLSLVLLIGAALLSVSFARLQQVQPGFDPSNALAGSENVQTTLRSV